MGIIDDALAGREDPGNKATTIRELDALKEENKKLGMISVCAGWSSKGLRLRIRKQKEVAFLNPSFAGMQEYDPEISRGDKDSWPNPDPEAPGDA